MDVISHKDELVYLKPLLSSTITNDVQQQVAERIGLQYESSVPRCKRCEESASFLRRRQHSRADVITSGYGKTGAKALLFECDSFRDAEASLPPAEAGGSHRASLALLKQGAPTGVARAAEGGGSHRPRSRC
jgi:hypothetical protein